MAKIGLLQLPKLDFQAYIVFRPKQDVGALRYYISKSFQQEATTTLKLGPSQT